MFGKIKQALGIGTVKVELSVPASVGKNEGCIKGTVKLTAKSDQEITNLHIKLVESYTTGRGDDKKTREFDLGEVRLSQQISLKNGEVREVPFSLTYQALKSNNDDLKAHGGALGALGKLGSFVDNEKSEYFVNVVADVKGTALDPSDRKPIKLVA
jgi:hypothetical protein